MQCKSKDKEGKKCAAHALKDEELCFFHSNSKKKALKEAQSKGGKANAIVSKTALPPLQIREVNDVVLLLEDTVNRVRAGEIDVRVGNCIGVLSGQLIKALEVVSVANRVEIIERAILEKRTRIS